MWKDMLLLIDLIIIMYVLIIGLIVIAFMTIESWRFIVKKFRKLRIHIKRWNKWKKNNINSWIHKLLVLFRLRTSPTFVLVLTDDEIKNLLNNHKEDLENDVR